MTIKQQGGIFGRNPTFNEVEADGGILANKSGGTPVVSNRTTNDGLLFEGQRNGTSVFKVGSISGVASYLILDPRTASGDGVGVRGANGNSSGFEAIWPTDGAGTASNGVLDLGNSSYRWKNGYFSGDINTSGGNLVVSNGKGIDFSATSGTGTSELFDDYEEGTFTPTIVGSTSAGSASYTAQTASYTKIGRSVEFQIYLVWSGGTGTGDLYVGGLPFTSASSSLAFGGAFSPVITNVTLSANNFFSGGYVLSGDTQIRLFQSPVAGGAASAVAYDAAGEFMLVGKYFV